MEPKYSMSAYAVVVVLAAITLALLGVRLVPIIASAAVVVTSGVFDLNYLLRWRRRARRHGALRASSRDELDRYAHRQVLAAGPLLLIVIVVLGLIGVAPLHHAPLIAKVLVGAVEIAATIILISSHVDWFWILPRISGVSVPGPCEGQRFEQWTGLTTVWLFHRLMAEVGVSATIIAIPTYMTLATSGKTQILMLVITAVTAPVVAFREKQVAQTVIAASDPPGKVGEIVRVHHDVDESNIWTWAYVVDVSVKGAKVVILEGDPPRYAGERFGKKADYLMVSNDNLRRARRDTATVLCPRSGAGCSGVNWYCFNNPNAHRQNVPKVTSEADELFEPVGAAPSRSY